MASVQEQQRERRPCQDVKDEHEEHVARNQSFTFSTSPPSSFRAFLFLSLKLLILVAF